MFKAITGITPRAYAIAHRAERLRDGLARRDTTVTEAIYEAGYNSAGRFYATSDQVLGMTPTKYRAGGAGSYSHALSMGSQAPPTGIAVLSVGTTKPPMT